MSSNATTAKFWRWDWDICLNWQAQYCRIISAFVPQMLFNMFNSVLGLNLLGAAGTPREFPSCLIDDLLL